MPLIQLKVQNLLPPPDTDGVVIVAPGAPAPPPPHPWIYAQDELPPVDLDEASIIMLGPVDAAPWAAPIVTDEPYNVVSNVLEEDLGAPLPTQAAQAAPPTPAPSDEDLPTLAHDEDAPALPAWSLVLAAPAMPPASDDDLPRVTFDEDGPPPAPAPLQAAPWAALVWEDPVWVPQPVTAAFDDDALLLPAAAPWVLVAIAPSAWEQGDRSQSELEESEGRLDVATTWQSSPEPWRFDSGSDAFFVGGDEDRPWVAVTSSTWSAAIDPWSWDPGERAPSGLEESEGRLDVATTWQSSPEPWRFDSGSDAFFVGGDEDRPWVPVTSSTWSASIDPWSWDPADRAPSGLEESESRRDVAATWSTLPDPWRHEQNDAFFPGGDEDPFYLEATRVLRTDQSQPWKFENAREEVAPALLAEDYQVAVDPILREVPAVYRETVDDVVPVVPDDRYALVLEPVRQNAPALFLETHDDIAPGVLLDQDVAPHLEPVRRNEPSTYRETHDDIAPGVLLDQDVAPHLLAISFSKDLINPWDYPPDELPPPEPPPTPTPAPVTSIAGGSMGYSPWWEPRPKRRRLRGTDLDDFLRELPGASAMELAQAQAEAEAQALQGRRALVARLRKLVALSGSDNVHEATAAATEIARMLREKGLLEDLAAFLDSADGGADGPTTAVVTLLLTAAETATESTEPTALAADVRAVATEALAEEAATRARWTVALGASGAALGLAIGGPVGAFVGAVIGGAVGRSARLGMRRSSATGRTPRK